MFDMMRGCSYLTMVGYYRGLCIFLISLLSVNAVASTAHYQELFADGKLDVTLALGFEQKSKDGGFPVVGPIANIFRGLKIDQLNALRDVELVEKELLDCWECGFKVVKRAKGERIYEAEFEDEKRLIKVRVRFIFALKGVSTTWLRRAFVHALGHDDLIMYIGHARDGRGFPDFGAPTGDVGKIFINDEFGGWMGFEKGYFSPTKYQILSVHACKTQKYFEKVIRSRVWEKDHSKLALIMTSDDSWFEDYPGTSVALIRGLMLRLDRQSLLKSLELAAPYYYGYHRGQEQIKPLFTADGFFDSTYVGRPRPQRKRPKEPWREIPFLQAQ